MQKGKSLKTEQGKTFGMEDKNTFGMEDKKPFGMEEATKLASSIVPSDIVDVVYVTSDKNVFYKANEGQARNHAKKYKLNLFEVKLENNGGTK